MFSDHALLVTHAFVSKICNRKSKKDASLEYALYNDGGIWFGSVEHTLMRESYTHTDTL